MNKKIGLLAVIFLVLMIFLAGCTASDNSNENSVDTINDFPNSSITAKWISDGQKNGADIFYDFSSEGSGFTETWSYKGTWTSTGATEDGFSGYQAKYNQEASYMYYLSENNSVLTDETDYVYVKEKNSNTESNEGIAGTWKYENSKDNFNGAVTFNPDGTIDETWNYYGNLIFSNTNEDGGYMFIMDYAKETWDAYIYLSSDGNTIKDFENFTFSKN